MTSRINFRSIGVLALALLAGCSSLERSVAGGKGHDAGRMEVGSDVHGDAPLGQSPQDAEREASLDPPDTTLPQDGGSCADACTAGAKRCGKNGGVESCISLAGCLTWGTEEACSGKQTCVDAAGIGACKCPAAPAGCNNMEGKFCSGTMLATCSRDGNGCYAVTTAACPVDQKCQGTLPSAQCANTCTNACTVGAQRCGMKNGPELCVLQGACTVWAQNGVCGGAQSCKEDTARASCQCPGAPSECNGTVGARFCSSISMLSTCTKDVATCLVANAVACGTGKHCEGTGAATQCVPDCSPETDEVFCQRTSARSCSMAMGTDNCGKARSVARCNTCSVTSCAADNYCTPVCATTNFSFGGKINELSVDGQQDRLVGASTNAESLLHVRRYYCQSEYNFILLISDRDANGTYVSQEITAIADRMMMRRDPTNSTISYLNISPDGLSLLGVSSDGRRFLSSKRSAVGAIDFGIAAEGAFELVNASISSSSTAVLAGPLQAGDNLAFYYQIINDPLLNGFYESVRKNPAEKFPAGTFLSPLVQSYLAVKGVSADRLTLMLLSGLGTSDEPYFTVFLTRKDVASVFSNPQAPNAAPSLAGCVGAVVSHDCGTVITTYRGTGDCLDEDIYRLNRN